MMRSLLAGTLLLASCAPVQQDDTPPPTVEDVPAPLRGAGNCKDEGLERFIGARPSTELGGDMLDISGAKILRWVGPDMVVTADYRTDRLTVTYDLAYTITKLRCV